MTPFIVYNNTGADIVFGSYTCPASSQVTIAPADVKGICQMPFFQINVMNSSVGVEGYGQDLSYGLNSAADIFVNRIANGQIIYS